MNKITGKQLAAALLASDAFALFAFAGRMSATTAAGFALGTILQFIAAAPALMRRRPPSAPEKAFLAAYCALWGGALFNMQWNASREIYIPYESEGVWGKLLVSGAIALVCLYIASAGVKATARAAFIAAAIGIVFLAVASASALSDARWENFSRASSEGGLLRETTRGFAMSGSLGGLVALAPITEGKPLRFAAGYFAAKLVIWVTAALLSVLAAGGIMEAAEFPAIKAAQLSQPFSSQRIDSLFLVVFAVSAVFAIGTQTAVAGNFIAELNPRAGKYAGAAALALSISSAFLFNGGDLYSPRRAAFAASALAVPIIGEAAFAIKRKEGARSC